MLQELLRQLMMQSFRRGNVGRAAEFGRNGSMGSYFGEETEDRIPTGGDMNFGPMGNPASGQDQMRRAILTALMGGGSSGHTDGMSPTPRRSFGQGRTFSQVPPEQMMGSGMAGGMNPTLQSLSRVRRPFTNGY